MRFYVVDDNLAVAATVKHLLEKVGHEVTVSPGGRIALEHIKSVKPDVIVLDIMMPELGGLDFCRLLRKAPDLKQMKIVILSGKANQEVFDQAMALGANGCLRKPIDPAHFIEHIQNIVGV
ncbi:hypothetical protein CCP2SC5_250046 [Azospirillaceae bacterium]